MPFFAGCDGMQADVRYRCSSAVEAVGNLLLVSMVEGGPEWQPDPVTLGPVIDNEHSHPTPQTIQRSRRSLPFGAGSLARPF